MKYDDFNAEDDFQGPFQEEEHPPGPLSKLPSWDHARPAFLLYLVFISASLLYWRSSWGDYLWISGQTFFHDHQYWRAFTSLAVHADAIHLLSNTLFFIIFGWLLNAYFGALLFPLAALISGACASAATVWFYEPGTRLMGASGMVYAMAALWLVFYIRHDYDRSLPARIVRATGFSLIILMPTVYNPSTSYLAHGIGFLFGIIAAFVMLPLTGFREEYLESDREGDDAAH